MNKYVLRTSLVWVGMLLILFGVMRYRFRALTSAGSASHPDGEVQPIARGPLSASAAPAHKRTMDTASPDPRLAALDLSPQRMQSIGVQLGSVEFRDLREDIRATGSVEIDQRLISYVQARYAGYIRKVFANATYQYVRKGQPLFTIYSPDLVATQREYLLARRNQAQLGSSTVDGVASGAATLSGAAEQRLLQWQVTPAEVAKLRQTGEPTVDLPFNAPASGFITEYNALPNMYVEPSTRLYTLADLSRVWVNAQLFQSDVSRVKPGDGAKITVDSYPGQTFSGTVEQILPQIDLTTRTVQVRLSVANPGIKLKPGMYVNVALTSNLGRRLVVPASAVFQSGTQQLVFVNLGNGHLESREIVTGPQVGAEVAVLHGLTEGQSVVTSANFLIDSESQLQAAAGAFTAAPATPPAGADMAATGETTIHFSTAPDPPQRGSDTLRVQVTDAGGAAVTGAAVEVKFFMAAMPAMSMAAMETSFPLAEKGAGRYEGAGKLDSSGSWLVTITVRKNGRTLAAKQLHVNAAGGM